MKNIEQTIAEKEKEIRYLEKRLLEENLVLDEFRKSWVKNAFEKSGYQEIPSEISLGNENFLKNLKFSIEKDKDGKFYWVAEGNRSIVLNGHILLKELGKISQLEWEKLDKKTKDVKSEDSLFLSKPVFKFLDVYKKKEMYKAPAYVLYKDDESGVSLVWRKTGVTYSDLNKKKPGLEIVYIGSDKKFEEKIKSKEKVLKKLSIDIDELRTGSVKFGVSDGILKNDLIIKNKEWIEALFGQDVVNDLKNDIDAYCAKKSMKHELASNYVKIKKP